MINNKDQVTLSALKRSFPVPSAWLVTFGWGRDFWINQENGWAAWDAPLPGWDDVFPNKTLQGWVQR